MQVNLVVKGMHCKSCVMLVQESLEEAGAEKIVITLDEKKRMGTVSCDGSSVARISKAVSQAGYQSEVKR